MNSESTKSNDGTCEGQQTVLLPPVVATCDTSNKRSRRKASKSKQDDEGGPYCISNCTHNGAETGTLVQCHMCQIWIHPECVGELNEDIVTIWTCKTCRAMPMLLQQVMNKMSAMENVITKLEASNQQLVTLVVEQRQELRGLREDVMAENRRPYAEVVRQQTTKTCLVVGNSLLRDIKPEMSDDGTPVKVYSKSGASFKEIGELMEEAAKKFNVKEIVIVGGTRETMDKVPLENIKEGMTQLIKVSSVLPWTKRADYEHVAEVNNTLRETCDEMNVTFVNQHVNFTFRNGEVDTAAFQKDGLHLSDSGVDRLLSNLSLPAQTRHKYSQQDSQANTQRPANHDNTDDARTDNAWRVVQRRRHTQQRRSLGQCDKCGETNHVTIRCKHDQQVQCRRCGDWGHKEKHHTRD